MGHIEMQRTTKEYCRSKWKAFDPEPARLQFYVFSLESDIFQAAMNKPDNKVLGTAS
jgi:hypothetical protein